MAEIDNNDVWGDDQLIASDISIPFLLQKADWTAFFSQKGFEGPYPMVLFMYDEAEQLNDALMGEVNRTQVLSGEKQLRVDVATKFVDTEGETPTGRALLKVSGLSEFDGRLVEDILFLLRSGVHAWLMESYSTHGVIPEVEWQSESERSSDDCWQEWKNQFGATENRDPNQRIMMASIEKS